jgi:hypothetical protein
MARLDYTPWHEDGCTLAEARERTADRMAWREWRDRIDEFASVGRHPASQDNQRLDDVHGNNQKRRDLELVIREVENRIDAAFRLQLTNRQLIAYGRRGDVGAVLQLISSDVWPAITKINWEKSSAGEGLRPGNAFFAVRVFPALLAPCRVDLIAGCSLSEVFKKFVLGDSEVAAVAKQALRLSAEFERVFVQGRCYVHGIDEWPLAFEGRGIVGVVHPDPKKRSIIDAFRKPDPFDVIIAAQALIDRYRAFIGMLRRGELDAQGLSAMPGHPGTILRSIWSHADFYFNANGDVFQVNRECEDPPRDWLTRRWIGVVLQRPHAPERPVSISTAATDKLSWAIPIALSHEPGIAPDASPFTRTDVADVGSLAAALEKLVFSHPTIQGLRERALKVAEAEQILFDEDAGLVGLVLGHEEPLLPLRYFPREDGDDLLVPVQVSEAEEDSASAEFFTPWPPEIEAFYDAVNLRARTLIGFLQTEAVIGIGHTVDGHLVLIAHTIWWHEDFYIHPPTGDIYEGGADRMKKRWTGVVLRAPAAGTAGFATAPEYYSGPRAHIEQRATPQTGLFHVKPPVHDGILPSTIEQQRSMKSAKAIANVETSDASYKACLAWLLEIMRASPDERTESRQGLWKKAQGKWGGSLSERSFITARTEAIRISDAKAWAAAGASRKSPRKSPH